MNVFGFDTDKQWDYENGYFLTSHVKRLAKVVAHYELYKKVLGLPGQIVECGVYKGASLVRLLTFRDILESTYSRKVIGFDAFGKFPKQADQDDVKFIERFEKAGGEGMSREELENVLNYKGFQNYALIEGDVTQTIPVFLQENPELRISMLHIDVDVYAPSKVILENLYERVVRGGIIVLDDYATVAGETRAVDEFIEQRGDKIKKLGLSHIPAYIEIA